MKVNNFGLAILVAVCSAPMALGAIWTPTNYGDGADAEVRESNPTQNRGSSTEIASRVKNAEIAGAAGDAGDRNSAIYVKIDLDGRAMPSDGKTAFRMTYRNNNLNGSRIQDTVTPDPNVRTGLAIYGLDTSLTWDEGTISYINAPGMTFDADVGTKDFNSDATFLGTVEFPEIGTQNHLPIGGALTFESANLDAYVADAFNNGASEVTLIATTLHSGDAPFGSWLNFNYLFNPKEQDTLRGDNYDPDGNGSIGNLYGTDNSTGAFSPSLLLAVPEPTSALLGLVSLVGLAAARRRS